MTKLKLYHPSNKLFKMVKVGYFGQNSYTRSDIKSSSIKRSFWYLTSIPQEKIFEHCKYSYVTEIKKDLIYNLEVDTDNLCPKFYNTHELLEYIKKNYIGVMYKPSSYYIVCLFNDIIPTKIIKQGGHKGGR